MTGPVSPHVRRIDPDAEAARLADERKLRTGIGHLLADEISMLDYDGEHGTLRVMAICTLPPAKIPPGVARDIADLVREQCYPADEP